MARAVDARRLREQSCAPQEDSQPCCRKNADMRSAIVPSLGTILAVRETSGKPFDWPYRLSIGAAKPFNWPSHNLSIGRLAFRALGIRRVRHHRRRPSALMRAASSCAPARSIHASSPDWVESLAGSPVVLIHGPRQCGMSTLAHTIGKPRGYVYLTFDDEVTQTSPEADPACVNSRPLASGRPVQARRNPSVRSFNSRPAPSVSTESLFQFTPARERATTSSVCTCRMPVSIHARSRAGDMC